jgi:hypothetical protein
MEAERRITSSESELPLFPLNLTRRVLQDSAQNTGETEVGAGINFLGVSTCSGSLHLHRPNV